MNTSVVVHHVRIFGVLEDAISFDDNKIIVSEASVEASSDDKDVI